MKIIASLFSVLMFTSCSQVSDIFKDSDCNEDSLIQIVSEQQSYIQELEGIVPVITIIKVPGRTSNINLFKPFNVKLELHHKRPSSDDKISFCVPAAYTTPQNKIDGLFIEYGEVINSLSNPLLTGVCILSDTGISITGNEGLTEVMKERTIQAKHSLFQQSLVLKDKSIVECTLFGARRNVRRALIQFNDFWCIGESDRPVTIFEFQQCLFEAGAKDAINLDMGSWSEGWYINAMNNKVTIGENMSNTSRQTNWIVYRKR